MMPSLTRDEIKTYLAEDLPDLFADIATNGASLCAGRDSEVTCAGVLPVVGCYVELYQQASNDANYLRELGSLDALRLHLICGSRLAHTLRLPLSKLIDVTALPTFGGAPIDVGGIVSWDDGRVLLRVSGIRGVDDWVVVPR